MKLVEGRVKYSQLIKKVQDYSGFSDVESKDALQLMVESLAVHLTENKRRNFASELPSELQDLALSVYATEYNSTEDILRQFMELEKIDENRAKRQIKAAWTALKDAISPGEIEDVKTQLAGSAVGLLT